MSEAAISRLLDELYCAKIVSSRWSAEDTAMMNAYVEFRDQRTGEVHCARIVCPYAADIRQLLASTDDRRGFQETSFAKQDAALRQRRRDRSDLMLAAAGETLPDHLAERGGERPGWDYVDETIRDSFPASDPPSWTGTKARPVARSRAI